MLTQISHNPILVVAAHPDDELLGCGGTIARLSRAAHDVYLAILGEGITSRYNQREEADFTLVEGLHGRCQEVAKMLGVRELFTYRLPDNRFDTVPLLDMVKVIEEVIERVNPEIIYTHHGGDLNVDHRLVNQAVLTATRPIPGQTVREICAFEIPSSTEWGFQRIEPVFRPNIFTDISGTLDLKLKALFHYEGEARAFPHPRSPEAIEAIARRWGSVVGREAVEAFELIRSIR
jgi:LmbE family N-acetylglucosaminyl deacetylase